MLLVPFFDKSWWNGKEIRTTIVFCGSLMPLMSDEVDRGKEMTKTFYDA